MNVFFVASNMRFTSLHYTSQRNFIEKTFSPCLRVACTKILTGEILDHAREKEGEEAEREGGICSSFFKLYFFFSVAKLFPPLMFRACFEGSQKGPATTKATAIQSFVCVRTKKCFFKRSSWKEGGGGIVFATVQTKFSKIACRLPSELFLLHLQCQKVLELYLKSLLLYKP